MRRSAFVAAGAFGLGLALVGQFALGGAASASPKPSPGARALDAIRSGAAIAHRDADGRVRYLSTSPGHAIAQNRSVSGASDAARSNVNDFAPLFGVANPATDLKQVQSIKGPSGPIVRFQQTHNGVPVIGGQLVVSDNASGDLVAINGVAGDADAVNTTAQITADTAGKSAAAAAAAANKVSQSKLVASAPALSIYDPALVGTSDGIGARTVYQVTVSDRTNPAVKQYVLVDATTGTIALSFSQAESFGAPAAATSSSLKAAPAAVTPATATTTATVCDFNNHVYGDYDYSCPGDVPALTDPDNSGITEAKNAYDYTLGVNDFYNNVLGRQGIDGNNMPLVSSTRFCFDNASGTNWHDCPYENAFWDGQQMVFGDGFASAPDVVGHELTHGVTQYTSDLLYYYQSGAINESMSDVMGELFQLSTGASDPTWLEGENLPGGAVRSMSHPPTYNQPGAMTSSLWDPNEYDAGGVHINSGVGNHAAFLAAMGSSTESGGAYNGIVVSGIQDGNMIGKMGAIWLGADELLTQGATYLDLANALKQSCSSLLTATLNQTTPADCKSVSDAIAAVKMTVSMSSTTEGSIPQASQCSSGYVPVAQFSDNFNRATGKSSIGTSWTTSGSPYISDYARPSVAAGNALYIPEPYPDTSPITRYAYTKSVTLSSSHTNYLDFKHLDSFDWFDGAQSSPTTSNLYMEGMFIDYQVSGSTTWHNLDTSNSTWVNGPSKSVYHTTFDPNKNQITYYTKFAGHAFAKDSRGWTSSRLTVSSTLAGKSVKFRFRIVTDGYDWYSSDYGAFLDDVSVHYCAIPPAAPTNVAVKGYSGTATMTWTGSSTNGGSSIKNYAVYIDKTGDGIGAVRTTLSSSARSYTWSNLTPGANYIFQIRALNSYGAYSPYVSKELYGTNLTLTATPSAITSGDTATLSGVLTQVNPSQLLSGRKITVYSRPSGTTTWTLTALTATTDSSGNFSIPVTPTASTDYYVSYSTGSQTNLGTNSPTVQVTVS